MELIMIGSAKGGTGKSTAAARLASNLSRRGIASGVVDMSPSPTAHWISGSGVFYASGRAATTAIAARAICKPHEGIARIAFVDTGRLDDQALEPWLPLCSGLLLVTSIDALSVAAMPAIWGSVERFSASNPRLRFLGFLPTMVQPGSERLRRSVVEKFPDWFLREHIPFDPEEARRLQGGCFSGQAAIAPSSPASDAWDGVATRVCTLCGIEPPRIATAPAPKESTRGVLSKLWGLAAKSLGATRLVTTEKGA